MPHVRADVPIHIVADLSWWEVVAIMVVGGGFIAAGLAGIVSSAPSGVPVSTVVFAALPFAILVMGSPLWMFVVIGLTQRLAWRRSSRQARAMLPGLPRSTWAEILAAEHLESMLASRGVRPLDPVRWTGPRTVVLDLELPEVLDCPDPAEPTRLDGPDRRRRSVQASRRERITARLFVWGLLVLPGPVLFLCFDWQLGLIVMGVTAAAVGTVVLARFVLRQNPELVRPIDIASTIVSPGRVERTVFGRTRVYDRSECVLVIEPRRRLREGAIGGRLVATVTHARNRPLKLEFAGVADPALHDLLGRWEFVRAVRDGGSVTRL